MIKINKGNYVADADILLLVGYDAPYAAKTIRKRKKEGGVLDITHNKASKSAIFLKSGGIVVLSVALSTMVSRINGGKDMNLIRITSKCYVPDTGILQIMNYAGEPSVRKKVQQMKPMGLVRDLTQRQKTKSAIFLSDGTVLLSPSTPETLVQNMGASSTERTE